MHLRRFALRLLRSRADLYSFPVLQFVEETSKILLMQEIELAYWYHLTKTYLRRLDGAARVSQATVRLMFFQTAMFVKRFLLQRMPTRGVPAAVVQKH